jgi:hypothetical protein
MKILKINTTVYAASRSYADKKLPLLGARVIPCKVKTYQNAGKNVIMILKSNEFKAELTNHSHEVYEKLEDAIKAITCTPVKRVYTKKKK